MLYRTLWMILFRSDKLSIPTTIKMSQKYWLYFDNTNKNQI